MNLASIRVLWRQPDTMSLWGIPHDMRPGQQPYDLWKASRDWKSPRPGWLGPRPIDLSDWIWLGSPGRWGNMTAEERAATEAFLAALPKDSIPGGPCEWTRLDASFEGKEAPR
jgi:hypothetical protein